VKWAVYGSYSGFHIFTNPEHADISPSTFDAAAFIPTMLRTKKGDPLPTALRMGMLINGVDVNTGSAGVISAVHGEEEMTTTVEAFRSTVRALKREGTVQ
jgi:glutamate-1-semialdehyde 2,1-aminomutase